ncbi:MAG: hypothetical protein L0Y80_03155 [Ignavibacteriae bacterium]|nr:hypothetical protein [Ignavibacteriota bacterium]
MKKLLIAGLVLALCSVPLMAQETMKKEETKQQDMKAKKEMKESKSMTMTVKGYLVDKMCGSGYAKGDAAKAAEKGMKHSKACALEEDCAASGYGIIMDGKYIKFDEKGDKLALEYLNKSSKKNDFLVEVAGMKDGDVLKVASLADAKMEKMEMKQDKSK